jgi:transcriptional regulator with XRE-family HTH domain
MGNQVKALREKKNLTQNELAEKAKLSLRTVQRIEAEMH